MSYQHDVFISYRSEENAFTHWAHCFRGALASWLQRELGDRPEIFIDHEIPVGADYPNHLAGTLARSKVMVAILSKDYFASDWCVHELDLMMERACGKDIIIPVVVHDGESIPEAVAKFQSANFKKYAYPWLQQGTPLHEDFWMEMGRLALRIGKAVEGAPKFDVRWEHRFRERFADVYAADAARKRMPPTGGRVPPKQFTLKAAAPPNAPPRMSI